MTRTIAIGDIHGCIRPLDRLLSLIAPEKDDTLVFLGDYIDRGPGSKQVIDRILVLRGCCRTITLLGNHEAMMRDVLTSRNNRNLRVWAMNGGMETLRSYGYDNAQEFDRFHLPVAHYYFIHRLQRYYETDHFIFSHASPRPDKAMTEQSEDELIWRRPGNREGNAHISGKWIVCGHTPQISGLPLQLQGMTLLDTYCFGGGWLSALDVNSRHLWQSNLQGEHREHDL